MPEPAGAGSLCIAFSREPLPPVLFTGLPDGIAFGGRIEGCPVRFARIPLFVAYPPGFATDAPHYTVLADPVHPVAEIWNIVIVAGIDVDGSVQPSIVAVAAVCAVEPHFKLVIAVQRKLLTLLEKDVRYIVVLAIKCTVTVPRRHIETVFHVQLACSFCKHLGNVHLGTISRGIRNVVCGGRSGP